MKKVVLLLATAVAFVGCGNTPSSEGSSSLAQQTPSSLSSVPDSSANGLEIFPDSSEVEVSIQKQLVYPDDYFIEYEYLPQPKRLDQSEWSLSPLVNDYLGLSQEDFLKQYDRMVLLAGGNTLYTIQDFPDKTVDLQKLFPEQVAPDVPDYWQTHSADIFGLSFGKGYSGEVLQGVSVGMSLDELVQLWGEPQFENEVLSLRGYKGNRLYIAIIGKERVEKIFLQKYLPLPREHEDHLILNQLGYYSNYGPHQMEHEEYLAKAIDLMGLHVAEIGDSFLRQTAPSSWGEIDLYSPYGLFETYSIWDPWENRYNLSVSSDYAGKVPIGFAETAPGYAVRDLDEAEGQLYRHILWDLWMKQGEKDLVVSPEGTTAYWVEQSPRFYSANGYRYTLYLYNLESGLYRELDCSFNKPEGWRDNEHVLCAPSIGYGENVLLNVATGEVLSSITEQAS